MDINSLDAVLHFLSYVPNVGAVSAGRLYEMIEIGRASCRERV